MVTVLASDLLIPCRRRLPTTLSLRVPIQKFPFRVVATSFLLVSRLQVPTAATMSTPRLPVSFSTDGRNLFRLHSLVKTLAPKSLVTRRQTGIFEPRTSPTRHSCIAPTNRPRATHISHILRR